MKTDNYTAVRVREFSDAMATSLNRLRRFAKLSAMTREERAAFMAKYRQLESLVLEAKMLETGMTLAELLEFDEAEGFKANPSLVHDAVRKYMN